MQNNKQFTQLGYMTKKMCTLADSQDKIGWRNFTEGYISIHFYNIQWFHLSMSSNYLNGADWTKQFISRILQLTHSQWMYRGISLHDKHLGYSSGTNNQRASFRPLQNFPTSAQRRCPTIADFCSSSISQN